MHSKKQIVTAPRDKDVTGAGASSLANGLNHLRLLQINVNKQLSHKRLELEALVAKYEVDVVMAQEAQCTKDCQPLLSGFTAFRCACEKCHKLVTFVRNGLTARQVDAPRSCVGRTDTLILEVYKRGVKYTCVNVYNPPKTELSFDLKEALYVRTVVAGDFNAKSTAWGCPTTDVSGRKVSEICDRSNLVLLQDTDSHPTFLHSAHGGGIEARLDHHFSGLNVSSLDNSG